jgi:hypothetical protein
MAKENYGNQFLYAEDLLHNGKYVTAKVRIAEYIPAGTLQAANRKVIDRPCLRFEGKQKMLVLSAKCNATVIHTVTGQDEGPGWVGHEITLQARVVDAFGDPNTLAIRVVPPPGTAMRKSIVKRLGREAVYEGPPPRLAQPPATESKTIEQLEAEAADRAAEQQNT